MHKYTKKVKEVSLRNCESNLFQTCMLEVEEVESNPGSGGGGLCQSQERWRTRQSGTVDSSLETCLAKVGVWSGLIWSGLVWSGLIHSWSTSLNLLLHSWNPHVTLWSPSNNIHKSVFFRFTSEFLSGFSPVKLFKLSTSLFVTKYLVFHVLLKFSLRVFFINQYKTTIPPGIIWRCSTTSKHYSTW